MSKNNAKCSTEFRRLAKEWKRVSTVPPGDVARVMTALRYFRFEAERCGNRIATDAYPETVQRIVDRRGFYNRGRQHG